MSNRLHLKLKAVNGADYFPVKLDALRRNTRTLRF
jgi:hypothetical protein